MLYSATDSQGRNHAHPQWRVANVTDRRNFPHLRTFGYDYVRLTTDIPQLTLVADRHDVMLGFGLSLETGGQMPEASYDWLEARGNGVAGAYFAYHSMDPGLGGFTDKAEDIAVLSGGAAEDIYYHYVVDTPITVSTSETNGDVTGLSVGTQCVLSVAVAANAGDDMLFPGERVAVAGVNGGTHPANGQTFKVLPVLAGDRVDYKLHTDTATPAPIDSTAWPPVTSAGTFTSVNAGTITVPGFPDGWAEKVSDSRAMVFWNGGWPALNINNVYCRTAAEIECELIVTTQTGGKHLKHLFLDTFDGLISGGFQLYPENIAEIRTHYGYVPTQLEGQEYVWGGLVDAYAALEAKLKTLSDDPNFVLIANASNLDSVYQWRTQFWKRPGYLNELTYWALEYCLTSLSGVSRILRLQQVYDDLAAGKKMFIRSQTNVSRPAAIPFRFLQFLAAAHYCINHDNAWFMIHEGTPLYGGSPTGTIIDGQYTPPNGTHWLQTQSVDVGTPVVRAGLDYWGVADTDRFYTHSTPGAHVVLARDYTNALVVCRFGSGGFGSIGTDATALALGGTYYELLADNTTGAAITSITLGQSEGAVLMRNPI